jgi:hypothetical protein
MLIVLFVSLSFDRLYLIYFSTCLLKTLFLKVLFITYESLPIWHSFNTLVLHSIISHYFFQTISIQELVKEMQTFLNENIS